MTKGRRKKSHIDKARQVNRRRKVRLVSGGSRTCLSSAQLLNVGDSEVTLPVLKCMISGLMTTQGEEHCQRRS
jgi:hypothetical protein